MVSSKDCLSLLGLLFVLSVSGGLPILAVVCCTVSDWYVVFCCLLAEYVPYASFVVDADTVDDDDGVGVEVDVEVVEAACLLAVGTRGSGIDLVFRSVDCFLKNYHCLQLLYSSYGV